MTPQQKAHLREYWRNIGGGFQGPATMPEERLLPLLDELHQARKVLSSDATELARLRGELENMTKARDLWRTRAVNKHDEFVAFANTVSADIRTTRAEHDRLTVELATLRTALAAAQADSARIEWLEKHSIAVRDPLAFGSRAMFSCTPDDFEGEGKSSNLRAAIDSAMKPTP